MQHSVCANVSGKIYIHVVYRMCVHFCNHLNDRMNFINMRTHTHAHTHTHTQTHTKIVFILKVESTLLIIDPYISAVEAQAEYVTMHSNGYTCMYMYNSVVYSDYMYLNCLVCTHCTLCDILLSVTDTSSKSTGQTTFGVSILHSSTPG